MYYQGSFIKYRCVRQRLGIRGSDEEKARLVWQIKLFVHDSSLPASTTSPDEQREVSHTSGLGCVIYFTQLNMGKSDTVSSRQDLERNCMFLLLPLALLPAIHCERVCPR